MLVEKMGIQLRWVMLIEYQWKYVYVELYSVKRIMNRKQTNKGMVLYEEVLQKNFEIIESFLNKFPMIFKKHQHFQESFRRVSQKNQFFEAELQKIKEDARLTTNLLEKKIMGLKESVTRNSRSSSRIQITAQGTGEFQFHQQQQKRISYKIGSNLKELHQKQSSSNFMKQNTIMKSQIQRVDKEMANRLIEVNNQIDILKQRVGFLSSLTSRISEQTDTLDAAKVGKTQFDSLSVQVLKKSEQFLARKTEEKYHLGNKLIDQKVSHLQRELSHFLDHAVQSVKTSIQATLSQKLNRDQYKVQVEEIKHTLERVVDECVETFADKEETQASLLLFEKKFKRFELIVDQNWGADSDPKDNFLECKSISLGVNLTNSSKENSLTEKAGNSKENIIKNKQCPKQSKHHYNRPQIMSSFGKHRR